VVHKVSVHPGHQRHRGVEEVSYNSCAKTSNRGLT
jgi:hypothetical protein